ncbi:MAG: serine/threonine protein kinase [Pseudonocardia sp.]|nr:serine/threonine protein kinase [Pseudonocardia sp.]
MIPSRVIGGRYVVVGALSDGVLGPTWRAQDRVTGHEVAVKELHLPAGLGPAEQALFRERLLREARGAGRLGCPGLIAVHDVVADSGVDHLVTEMLDARRLAEVVARSGPLGPAHALEVARTLLETLRAAHGGGIVHGSVRPEAVLLVRGGRVVLTDVGLAPALDDRRLTGRVQLTAEPGFLAPERLAGGPATEETDLWSLGATLFHAVEGRGPFARPDVAGTRAAVLDGPIPVPGCGDPLASTIGALLRRDPGERASATEALAALGPRAEGREGGWWSWLPWRKRR